MKVSNTRLWENSKIGWIVHIILLYNIQKLYFEMKTIYAYSKSYCALPWPNTEWKILVDHLHQPLWTINHHMPSYAHASQTTVLKNLPVWHSLHILLVLVQLVSSLECCKMLVTKLPWLVSDTIVLAIDFWVGTNYNLTAMLIVKKYTLKHVNPLAKQIVWATLYSQLVNAIVLCISTTSLSHHVMSRYVMSWKGSRHTHLHSTTRQVIYSYTNQLKWVFLLVANCCWHSLHKS